MISISSNLNIMIKAAEKASKSVIRDFGEVEKLQVSKKGPYDFVTKTDKHVEKILIEELSKIKKNYSFLSEEVGTIKNKDQENVWIIDPIDGTTNFLHGIPHFAICIALQSKKEIIGEQGKLLSENLEVTVSFYNENPISIELPNQVKCKIETTDVALKGQTVSSSYKPATLDNGLNIQVPPFIESGDEVIVDTRNLEYIKKI